MSQEIRQIFATNVKKLRESKQLKREELSLLLGFDNSYISKIEKQRVNITIDKISKYQDEKSKKMFDAYISQLTICQNLSESQELTVEERGRYFDLSMDLLGRMEVHEEKDNQRKENDKKRKWVAFGLTIVGIVGTIGATLIASQNSKK